MCAYTETIHMSMEGILIIEPKKCAVHILYIMLLCYSCILRWIFYSIIDGKKKLKTKKKLRRSIFMETRRLYLLSMKLY